MIRASQQPGLNKSSTRYKYVESEFLLCNYVWGKYQPVLSNQLFIKNVCIHAVLPAKCSSADASIGSIPI